MDSRRVNGVTLNGPKGIWLFNDALYVADIDTLRIFDRFTGTPRRSIPFPNPFAPNALFLNDLVVSQDGTAYVTDNANGAVFRVDSPIAQYVDSDGLVISVR